MSPVSPQTHSYNNIHHRSSHRCPGKSQIYELPHRRGIYSVGRVYWVADGSGGGGRSSSPTQCVHWITAAAMWRCNGWSWLVGAASFNEFFLTDSLLSTFYSPPLLRVLFRNFRCPRSPLDITACRPALLLEYGGWWLLSFCATDNISIEVRVSMRFLAECPLSHACMNDSMDCCGAGDQGFVRRINGTVFDNRTEGVLKWAKEIGKGRML